MRLPRVGLTVRSLMGVVAVIAVLMGHIAWCRDEPALAGLEGVALAIVIPAALLTWGTSHSRPPSPADRVGRRLLLALAALYLIALDSGTASATASSRSSR